MALVDGADTFNFTSSRQKKTLKVAFGTTPTPDLFDQSACMRRVDRGYRVMKMTSRPPGGPSAVHNKSCRCSTVKFSK